MPGISVGEESNGRRLELHVGDSIEVQLPENPTTGWRWQVIAAAEPVCEKASQTFEPARADKPGAPGLLRCEFRVVVPGNARIELVSKRAWSSELAGRFTLEVTASA